jgi:hypothetical protein
LPIAFEAALMRNASTLSSAVLSAILLVLLPAGPAHALDKVDPYICPTMEKGSAIDCFLEAIPQTYTMCRHIKSIEVLEFGLAGAEEGVNGAKTESCIDKHKLSVNRPYQAALRAARNANEVQSLRKLYAIWLDSLAKLHPMAAETDEEYKARVVRPYAEFTAQISAIHALVDVPAPGAKRAAKSAPSTAGSK